MIDSVTGAPISQALVQLWGSKIRQGSSKLADASGRFRFSELAEGEYRLNARKPHYSGTQGLPGISVGPSREDVTVRLEPLALIKGRILDSFGDPVAGVMVHALELRVQDGRRRYQMLRWARTNDRGDYRLWDLRPGRYYVKVAGRTPSTLMYVGELPPAESDESFITVYYGGGHSAAEATPFMMAAGATAQADFSLPLEPGHTISGTVVNATRNRSVQVTLFRGEEDVGATLVGFNTDDGRFRIQGVVDGKYTLRITQGDGDSRLRANETVEVAGRDVTGLRVALVSGVTVQGTVRFDIAPPSSRRRFTRVNLQPLDPQTVTGTYEQGPGASAGEDGRFAIAGVLPGRYRLNVIAPGYAASILSGDNDLSAGGELVVNPMQAVPPLDISIRTDTGAITGSLVVDGRPSDGLILLLPSTGEAQSTLAASGTFHFSVVPPGEYRVYAFRDREELPAYAEPDVARILSGRGERVQVAPKGEHRVELTSFTEVER